MKPWRLCLISIVAVCIGVVAASSSDHSNTESVAVVSSDANVAVTSVNTTSEATEATPEPETPAPDTTVAPRKNRTRRARPPPVRSSSTSTTTIPHAPPTPPRGMTGGARTCFTHSFSPEFRTTPESESFVSCITSNCTADPDVYGMDMCFNKYSVPCGQMANLCGKIKKTGCCRYSKEMSVWAERIPVTEEDAKSGNLQWQDLAKTMYIMCSDLTCAAKSAAYSALNPTLPFMNLVKAAVGGSSGLVAVLVHALGLAGVGVLVGMW